MAGNDLIGSKQAPDGTIVGLDVRGGDAYHPLGTGPVIPAVDPLTGLTRLFRYSVLLQDNGDGTTTPIPILEEVILS